MNATGLKRKNMHREKNKNPVANPAAVLREEFDDWAVLFDPDINNAYGLHPVSVIIWKCLDGKHSIKDIAELIRQRCNNVPKEIEEHVKGFVGELIKKGLAGYRYGLSNKKCRGNNLLTKKVQKNKTRGGRICVKR